MAPEPAGPARSPAGEPPGDAAVLRAIPSSFAGVSRDDVVIVKEEVNPGRWKCTAYYTESVLLPWWGRVQLGKRVQSVVIQPLQRIDAARRGGDRA